MTPLEVLSEHLRAPARSRDWITDQFLDCTHLRPADARPGAAEYLIWWSQLIVFSPSSMTVERAYEALRGLPAGGDD